MTFDATSSIFPWWVDTPELSRNSFGEYEELPAMIWQGEYRYEMRHGPEFVAVEMDRFEGSEVSGVRRSVVGAGTYEARAKLDPQGFVMELSARYARGPFSRSATYQAGPEFLRGTLSTMGARTAETAKLGRLREIDGGLVLFKALILAHIRSRGEIRWTGRVAVLNPDTLVAASTKQTYRQKGANPLLWIYEPRMGDLEEIELDTDGRIVRIADGRGFTTRLLA